MSETKKRSVFWYALPIFLSVIGGIIAYFILRQDDPEKAKNCLLLGIILAASYVAYYIVFWIMLETFEFV